MQNEANREVCGAAAIRKCETKPIRGGGGARQDCLGHRCGTKPIPFSDSTAMAIRWQATKRPNCGGRAHGKTAWAIGMERSQSHFRTVWQSGNPSLFPV